MFIQPKMSDIHVQDEATENSKVIGEFCDRFAELIWVPQQVKR